MKYSTGFYEPFRLNLNQLFGINPESQVPFTSVLAGAVSGAVGGEHSLRLANPSQRSQRSIQRLLETRYSLSKPGCRFVNSHTPKDIVSSEISTRLILQHSQLEHNIITEAHLMLYQRSFGRRAPVA